MPVVKASGSGSRWKRCRDQGKPSMQPESVSMSPVMWVAQPSSTAMGMNRRPYPYQIAAAATAIPARSATWPRARCSASSAADTLSVISSASPALPPQSARKWQETQASAVKTAMPRKECVACRWPPLIRPKTQATASDTKPSDRAGEEPHWSRSGSSAMPAVKPASAAVCGMGRCRKIPAARPATPPDRACECPSISPTRRCRAPARAIPTALRGQIVTKPGEYPREARSAGRAYRFRRPGPVPLRTGRIRE